MPSAWLKCGRRGCVNIVGNLWKSLGQVLDFCTQSPHPVLSQAGDAIFYTNSHTSFTHFWGGFTQPKSRAFNLLSAKLYPVSTSSINNTNLIKE